MRLPKSFRRKSKAEITLYICVSAFFALLAASYVYILVWAILAGLKTHLEIAVNPFSLPAEWHWEHFIEVFSLLEINGNDFFDMLWNSIYFSVGCALASQLTTVAFAYCCTKYKFPGSNLPYTIIMIMLTLPLYGTGAAAYRMNEALGLINSYWRILLSLGGFSMNFLYYRAYYKNVSNTYSEAAIMDGADDFQIYFKVMLPQAKPIIGALFLTNWITNWNTYESALIYLPQLPTLPVGIYQFNTEMIYQARLDILFAACVIISIPAIVLFVVFNKMITTNVSVGGIKG